MDVGKVFLGGAGQGEIVKLGGSQGHQPTRAGDLPCNVCPHQACSGHVSDSSDGNMSGEGCGPGRRSRQHLYISIYPGMVYRDHDRHESLWAGRPVGLTLDHESWQAEAGHPSPT
jgi:hypothetical protein